MVWNSLVIQMADAGNEWRMSIAPCPVNRFPLRVEPTEHTIPAVFDDVAFDGRSFRAAFRTSFDIHVRHRSSRALARAVNVLS